MKDEVRYFVLHLDERDYKPHPDVRYQVQVLDEHGRALASGYLGDQGDDLAIDGKRIPVAVIRAARRQLQGKGDYVDATGNSIRPF